MSMVEVLIPNLDCEGCASTLKKSLFKLKGVEEVEADMDNQKVTVRGYGLEEEKVMKAIKREGKAAEAWPLPGYNHHYSSFYKYPTYVVNHYYETPTPHTASTPSTLRPSTPSPSPQTRPSLPSSATTIPMLAPSCD